MNWLAVLALGALDLAKRLLFVKDPPRTDRKPVDLNPKPPEKSE